MVVLPKISIIIPVYNVEQYISECIRSVMRQTYTGEMECILVDDCGTDNSIAIVQQLVADYKGPIRFNILHHDHNRLQAAARNTALEVASGDYIYFLDSDDYISEDCLEELAIPLRDYAYDMVIGGILRFDGASSMEVLRKETGAIMSQYEILYECYMKRSLNNALCNKLWKKSLFQKYDLTFYEGILYEDTLWLYKFMSIINTLYVQNKITYYYRVREGSTMQTFYSDVERRIRSVYIIVDYVLSNPMKVDKDLWNPIAASFVRIYGQFIYGRDSFRDQFIELCQRLNYQPIDALIRGKLAFSIFKKMIYMIFPPAISYIYLQTIVRIKHFLKK